MDNDLTQPVTPEQTVNFRCTCGELLVLPLETGGRCGKCEKEISPRVINHELSRTMAIHSTNSSGERSSHDFTVPAIEGDPDLIGKSLGHFEIIEPLGRGGMAQVFRAFDQSLKRYVAVKVLNNEGGLYSTERQLDVLLQEAVAQARVSHPNIVSIYYIGKHADSPFLAMELVPGKTLSERLAESPMSFYDTVFVGWQISQALGFSHELDLLHGDIKPSNILIQENGVIKISDFGMARRVSEETNDKVGGTPNYLAPELLSGGKPSIQSDMYALGVTLFEMTFGRRPISLSGSTLEEWAKTHADVQIEFPHPWPEEIHEEWRDILHKLLNRDPANRYADYESLSQDLARVAPAQNMPARLLPRLIAAGIDHLLVGTAFVFIVLVNYFAMNWISGFMNLKGAGWLNFLNEGLPWYLTATFIVLKTLLSALGFVPIVMYTLALGYSRQSFGRALMHIRVVNQFGLKPKARMIMGRSVLRMAWMWGIGTMVLLPLDEFSTSLIPGIGIGLTAFSLADLAYMVLMGNGTSLHDRWYKSRVVLDTQQY